MKALYTLIIICRCRRFSVGIYLQTIEVVASTTKCGVTSMMWAANLEKDRRKFQILQHVTNRRKCGSASVGTALQEC